MRRNAMALLAIGLVLGAARAGESVDDQLRRAFAGEDAPLRAPIKVVWKEQGVVVTASSWTFVPDSGQVRLTGCHVLRSPADPSAGVRPVAVQARNVVLTYDAPVRRSEELVGRKLIWVSAELDAGVRLELTRR
jgi:hypothetical protein